MPGNTWFTLPNLCWLLIWWSFEDTKKQVQQNSVNHIFFVLYLPVPGYCSVPWWYQTRPKITMCTSTYSSGIIWPRMWPLGHRWPLVTTGQFVQSIIYLHWPLTWTTPIGNDVDHKGKKCKHTFCHRKEVAGTRLRKFDIESELFTGDTSKRQSFTRTHDWKD